MTTHNILIVDDKPDVRLSLNFLLSNHGYTVEEASSLQEAQQRLTETSIDLILLDMNYQLDTTSGEEGLAFIKAHKQADKIAVPIIAMTAWSTVDLVVRAMQVGAVNFFAKPWDNQGVLALVRKQLALSALVTPNVKSEATPESPSSKSSETSNTLQWHGGAMIKLRSKIDRIAKTNAAVLLRGENGTGKTSIAEYIHNQSGVSGAFVSVNVAAIPESLFESELFGHRKGAFTDAKDDRVGRFEAADNGTLFLDEIGCLPLALQAKLLRVLESNEYERVGDNTTKRANCRIICASNADFEALISNGDFRSDLYFRINPIELTVPSLRDRRDEIVPLAEHFLKYHSEQYEVASPTLSHTARSALVEYHWPGNVRELSHFMARGVLMCDDAELQPSDFAFKHAEVSKSNELPMITLEDAEKRLLMMAMQKTNNNVEDAALLLGISKSAIYRRLEKFKLNKQGN
ncbi:sigma-54-dependent Fis family transcriptional regulator [Alteromonas sp. KUL49]|nr:sigma-54-dependent Fis family transcriptional regulator [Alteromonas sp. KUL49]